MKRLDMTKTLKFLLLFLFLFQVAIAAGFDLSHDEAYYWLFSKHLDWGYFDHPPMMAVVIKLFSFLPHSELAVRLGFILLQFATLGLIFILVPSSAWLYSTLLFFAFPLSSFAGLLALPDMPLLFLTALYCYGLKIYLTKPSMKVAVGLGTVIALLFYAKYHGILLVFFTILAVPRILLRKDFYVTALVTAVLFLPHVFWQYAHDFATLRYHFLERPSSSFSVARLAEYLGSQIILAGLLIGPIVWWKTLQFKSDESFSRSMKVISLGVVGFFFISTISKKFEANWTIFLAPPLIYLMAQTDLWSKAWAKRLTVASFVIVLLARILLVLPPTLIPIKRLGEFHGWKAWAETMKKDCGDLPLVANSYQMASKLSYYLETELPALNLFSRKNQFNYWKFESRIPDQTVCYLTDKAEFQGQEFETPDRKLIKMVTDKKLSELRDGFTRP
jgi:4-amino-4-deoxy-L-arabinose transferase-like glycosyltransferase